MMESRPTRGDLAAICGIIVLILAGLLFVAAGLSRNLFLSMVGLVSLLATLVPISALLWRDSAGRFRRAFAFVVAGVLLILIGLVFYLDGDYWLSVGSTASALVAFACAILGDRIGTILAGRASREKQR